jgi:prevent-host-death family protein
MSKPDQHVDIPDQHVDIEDAQERLVELVEHVVATGEKIFIDRDGIPVAVIIPYQWYEKAVHGLR